VAQYVFTDSRFPNGTTLYATPLGFSDEPITASVASGSATFSGLRELTRYVVRGQVAGRPVESRFTSPSDSAGGGSGVPVGGTTGQVLKKNSNTDGDASWAADSSVPTGGSTGQVLKKNSGSDGDAAWASEVASYTTFEQPGVVATAAGRGRFVFGANATILSVRAACAVAPVGASLICDVNKNGTTIFTTQANRPAIAAGSNASSAATPDVTSVAAGDYLTVDIDQVGSTTAGEDLVVTVRFRES
jgi:hypothetical protein